MGLKKRIETAKDVVEVMVGHFDGKAKKDKEFAGERKKLKILVRAIQKNKGGEMSELRKIVEEIIRYGDPVHCEEWVKDIKKWALGLLEEVNELNVRTFNVLNVPEIIVHIRKKIEEE